MMAQTFVNYDPKAKMMPGETYRITVRIPTKYQSWYRDAVTNLVKLGDYAEKKYEVKTVEFLHPSNITNPDYFYIRITFLRTGEGFDPNSANEAALITGQQIFYLAAGIIFSAIAVSALLDHFEHAVAEPVKSIVTSPAVLVAGLVIAFLIFRRSS